MITGKEIWKEVVKDPGFMSEIPFEGQQNIIQEYVENNFLDVIRDILNNPVTAENITKAKIAFKKDVLKTGTARKVIEVTPEKAFVFIGKKDAIAMADGVFKGAIEHLEPIAANVQAFLEEYEIDETYLYARFGLNKENIALAQNDELTIEELLISQPGVILNMKE